MISRWLERRAAKFLRRRGYFVGQGRDLSDRYSASYLASYGFQISTLVDVGVLDGSPVFYELFGDKKIVAVDPLPDIARRMKPWQDQGLDIVIVMPERAQSTPPWNSISRALIADFCPA